MTQVIATTADDPAEVKKETKAGIKQASVAPNANKKASSVAPRASASLNGAAASRSTTPAVRPSQQRSATPAAHQLSHQEQAVPLFNPATPEPEPSARARASDKGDVVPDSAEADEASLALPLISQHDPTMLSDSEEEADSGRSTKRVSALHDHSRMF